MSKSLVASNAAPSQSQSLPERYKEGLAQNNATLKLASARYVIGSSMVFSALGSVVGVLVGFPTLAETTAVAHTLGLTHTELYVLIATLLASGPVGVIIGYSFLEERGNHTFHSPVSKMLYRRKLRRDIRALGWRPIDGAPKLSANEPPYPQYAVNKEVIGEGENMSYKVSVSRYTFEKQQWSIDKRPVESVTVPLGEEEKLVESVDEMRALAEQKNQESYQAHVATLTSEEEKAQAHAAATAQSIERKNLDAQRRKHAKQLLDQL